MPLQRQSYRQVASPTRVPGDVKDRYLGQFDLEEDAAEAYNLAAQDAYGEHASLNNISTPAEKGSEGEIIALNSDDAPWVWRSSNKPCRSWFSGKLHEADRAHPSTPQQIVADLKLFGEFIALTVFVKAFSSQITPTLPIQAASSIFICEMQI
jgi:hypothetical protein